MGENVQQLQWCLEVMRCSQVCAMAVAGGGVAHVPVQRQAALAQLLQARIRRQQHGRFSPGQSQIQAGVHRVIQMAGQCQSLHLQVAVGFDVIHQRSGPVQAQPQAIGAQLSRSLHAPQGIGHLGEHQFGGWCRWGLGKWGEAASGSSSEPTGREHIHNPEEA
jgi:hypothetical protein